MPAPFGLPAELAELQEDYELLGELGRGGAAVVYRARDRALRREVAVKVVHPRPTSPDDDPVARLAREARLVAQLQHPNIVAVYAVRRLRGGGIALIMQLVSGGTLKTAVQTGGALTAERVEACLRDVAAALAYAHARDLVHRDVKPENIFLDERSGRALLADFGIARSAEPDSMTMTGTAVGTPFYMSPEQVDGGVLDGRSDLYSLGLVAWEALTGRRPWDGESLYNVIYKQKFEELPPIEALRPGVPRRLQYLVERMLQKRPGARWAGAEGLLAQLDHPVLPADYTNWQRVLPGRVERYRETEAERADERARITPNAAPLSSASTLHFAPGATPATSGPVLAEPSPNGSGASRPWVPGPAGPTVTPSPARDRTSEADVLPQPGTTVDLQTVAATSALLGRAAADGATPIYADAVDPVWVAPGEWPARGRRGWRVPVVTGAALSLLAAGAFVAYDLLGPVDRPRTVVRSASTVFTSAVPPAAVPKTPAATESPLESSGATLETPSEMPPAALPLLASGGRHTCALTLAGGAHCWGANDRGQLGDGGPAVTRTVPVPVAGVLSFTALASGFAHSCALTRLGDVYCWGVNTRGQLGDATTVPRNAPTRVAGPSAYTLIAAGSAHSCGVTTDRALRCWGANDQGQLGNGLRQASLIPTAVRVPGAVVAVAAGGQHTCAVTDTGRLFCWGANTYGQLGNAHVGGASATPEPVALPAGTRALAVGLGLGHSCAVTADGALWCWGRNDAGQLGDGTRTSRATPVRARLGADRVVASVASGAAHTCAIEADGALTCWGRNTRGALGDGSSVNRVLPTRVPLPAPVAAASAGTGHTCATTVVGTTLCWGDNSDGQLGDSTVKARAVPALVSYPAGVAPRTSGGLLAQSSAGP